MANSFVHIVPLSFASIINGLFGSSTSRFPFTFFLWLSLAFTFCVLLCFDSRFNASVLLHSFTSLLFFVIFLVLAVCSIQWIHWVDSFFWSSFILKWTQTPGTRIVFRFANVAWNFYFHLEILFQLKRITIHFMAVFKVISNSMKLSVQREREMKKIEHEGTRRKCSYFCEIGV